MKNSIKTCPESERLADYVAGNMGPAEKESFERHIAGCNVCLKNLSLSAKADSLFKTINMAPASSAALAKAIAASHVKPRRNAKRHLWLGAAIIAFAASFVFPRYFLQCLVATILLGIKWIAESENMRTMILVLDSWRRHGHGRESGAKRSLPEGDEEISGRLKDRTGIKDFK
jgi:anti-sigma factor RsiW